MDNLTKTVLARWSEFSDYVEKLMVSNAVILGVADPPNSPGVYVIYDEKYQLSYIGKAVGARGLRDRLLSKHLSGDDSHAVQRAYKEIYPDRSDRRNFMKANLQARWIVVEDISVIADLERLLIWLYQPQWNRQ